MTIKARKGATNKKPGRRWAIEPAALAAELRDMAKMCHPLNDDIVEAVTNSDAGFRGEAFEGALRAVLDLRVMMADLASKLEGPSAEVQS